MSFVSKYGKAIVAIVVAALVAISQALGGDQHVEPGEWVAIAIAVATAVGVWLVPLAPQAKYGKTAVAVVLAALQVLTTSLLDGFGSDDILLVLLTVGGAIGVYIAPAVSTTPAGTPAVAVGVGSDD